MAQKNAMSKIPPAWWLVLLVVVVAFLYGYAAYVPSSPYLLKSAFGVSTPQEQQAASFAATHPGLLLNYTDPTYGYSISYPVGYNAQNDPDIGVSLRFIADYPGSSSEVIDVSVQNQSFTQQDFTDAQANYSSEGTLTFAQQEQINGNPAYVLGAQLLDIQTNETLYVRQGVIACPVPSANPSIGNYWVTVTAVIPQALDGDLPLAQYMINSVKC